jgi:Fur family ferric uptake transcriptional regulator
MALVSLHKKGKTMSCEKLFYKALKDHGFRLTPQREIVLEVMHQFKRPVSVEEIHEQVQKRSQSLDLVTIYRNLELLQQFGLVSSIETSGRQRLYEYLGSEEPHLHLVCRACGKIMPADLEIAGAMLAQLCQQYNFNAELNEISIPGLCQECQQAGRLPHIPRVCEKG